jgi:TetR/AcrR family transcriptional regulator, fatty acid metabolism regulator protein
MAPLTLRQTDIVNTSLGIILEKGIRSLTLKNIADEMGVTDASLYKHFRSKNDIMIGITEIFRNDSTKLLKEILSEKGGSIPKIKFFFLNRCLEFSKNRLLSIVLFSDDVFGDDKTILKIIHSIMEEHGKMLSLTIREGQKSSEIRDDVIPEHIFMLVMGPLRLLVTKWRASGFSFDLYKNGEKLWQSVEKVISK